MSRTPILLAIALLGLIPQPAYCWQDPFEVARKQQTSPDGKAASDARSTSKKDQSKTRPESEPEFVRKTDAEWRKVLTRDQYEVTRNKATEPAFSGKYATGHFRGTFVCVCCKAPLFSSRNKFDSGTGWPSFWQPYNARAVAYLPDYSALEPRIEVECRRCGAHLGHVFDDGPLPTGKRFCINSLSLVLKPDAGAPAEDTPTRKRTSSRTRSRSRASTKSSTARKAQPGSATPSEKPAQSSEPSTPNPQ